MQMSLGLAAAAYSILHLLYCKYYPLLLSWTKEFDFFHANDLTSIAIEIRWIHERNAIKGALKKGCTGLVMRMRFAAIWHISSGSNERTNIFILPAFSTLLLCFYIACVSIPIWDAPYFLYWFMMTFTALIIFNIRWFDHHYTKSLIDPTRRGWCINKSSDI